MKNQNELKIILQEANHFSTEIHFINESNADLKTLNLFDASQKQMTNSLKTQIIRTILIVDIASYCFL